MATHLAPRILVVDDNTAIHEDFRKILGDGQSADPQLADLEQELFDKPGNAVHVGSFRVDFASQGPEGVGMVEAAFKAGDPYALAFVDIRMPPGWDGVETIERCWQICPDLQTVICTAYSDYSWQEIIGRIGDTDNLVVLKKPFETVEVLQLAHALTRKWALGRQARLRLDELERMAQERAQELCREMEERVRAQSALRVSEERFTKAFESSPMPMAIQSWPEGSFLAVNSRFQELAGYPPAKILQHGAKDLQLWVDEGALNDRLQTAGCVRNFSAVLRRADGALRDVMLGAERLQADAQPCLLLVAEDVTERLKLEAGLRKAQKLEVVGRMVASIAHEFNNVLTVIQGHASLLQTQQVEEQRPTECTDRILQASHRAAKFTRQLLGISRQQPVHFGAVNLAASIRRVQELLEQSLCARHELKPVLADGLPLIRADEFNVEQAIINLILNARDAMPKGGDIVVGACAVTLTETEVAARRQDGAKAGTFVCLAVSDRGCGIPREIAGHIFEPFFTTKEIGRGTGLGLWMVQNTIQQHGGWIELVSEVGRGSTFKIFLPVWKGPAPAETVEIVRPGEPNELAGITGEARADDWPDDNGASAANHPGGHARHREPKKEAVGTP